MPFNYPIPFIRYMLQVILACYKEIEERVGLMNENGNGSTAYDIVNRKMSLPQVDRALQLFDRAELSFCLCHRGCS